MGYRTQYELGIHCDMNEHLMNDSRRAEILAYFQELDVDTCLSYFAPSMKSYPRDTSWHAGNEMKWYEHETDMRELSLKFPDIIFVLGGIGEDEEDRWRKYFLNGRAQECRAEITIIYPEFDASLME